MTTRDGADIAKQGFRDQALACAAIALSSDDWAEVTCEPKSQNPWTDHRDIELKTDVRWVLRSGTTLRDQVKSYGDAQSLNALKGWAKELDDRHPAGPNRVVYIGPVGTTACGETELTGTATLRHLADRRDAVEDAVELALLQLAPGLTRGIAADARQRLVSAVDELSDGSTKWTPATFQDLAMRCIGEAKAAHVSTQSGFDVRLRRWLIALRDGSVVDVLAYQATNTTDDPRQPALGLTWSEARTSLLHVWPGDTHRLLGSSDFHLDIEVRGPTLAPSEQASWGVVALRDGLLDIRGRRRTLGDPFLPAKVRTQVNTTLILDAAVDVRDLPELASMRARRVLFWSEVAIPGRPLRNTVTWSIDPGLPPLATDDESFSFLLEAAKAVGLSAVPLVFTGE